MGRKHTVKASEVNSWLGHQCDHFSDEIQREDYLNSEMRRHPAINCQLVSATGTDVMAAADVVVCASGTATLEVMLVNRPMVVCYRLAAKTYALVKWFKLVKSRFFALPNILADEALVPELLQHEVTGDVLRKRFPTG